MTSPIAGCYHLVATEDDAGTTYDILSPTEHVGSPWGPGIQHGGPPAGLLVRAMDRLDPQPDARIAKVSVDLLGAVPMSEVRVTARMLRPGRRITLLGARLEAEQPDGSWRAVAQATAWRQATQPTDDVVHLVAPREDLPADLSEDVPGGTASGAIDQALPEAWEPVGFVNALSWRVTRPFGGGPDGGPSAAWVRLDQPLVAGEETSPLEAVVMIADVTNGVGARLDPVRFSFLNTELTVHLHDVPKGPWFGVVAETTVGADGVGMGSAVLHDPSGPIGRVAQSLLVERR